MSRAIGKEKGKNGCEEASTCLLQLQIRTLLYLGFGIQSQSRTEKLNGKEDP